MRFPAIIRPSFWYLFRVILREIVAIAQTVGAHVVEAAGSTEAVRRIEQVVYRIPWDNGQD